MKLQPASKKELTFIAKGTVICTLVMLAVFLVLSVTGVYPFSWRVPLAAAGGCAVAVANFYLLCLTVQSAAGMDDQKALKAKVQASYNGRLMLQAVWVIVCFLVPQIHLVAGAVPLLYPPIIIYYLQAKGKLLPPDPPRTEAPAEAADEEQAEEEEDHLGPFEV